MNDSAKKKHLYAVSYIADTMFVLAHTRQQAVNAVAARVITAERAEAMAVLDAGVKLEDVIDATTGHAQQATLPLTDALPPTDEYLASIAAPTAAEALEPPVEEREHVE